MFRHGAVTGLGYDQGMSAPVRRDNFPRRAVRRAASAKVLPVTTGGAIFICLSLVLLRGEGAAPATADIATATARDQSRPLAAPSAPAPSLEPPTAAVASGLEGLVLKGVFAGGPGGCAAIMLLPGGVESVVPVGAEFLPGYRLKALEFDHAVLSTGSGDLRLKIGLASGATAVSAAQLGNTDAPSGSASADSHETGQYRDSLEPVKNFGRISGFALAGAAPPVLQKAGMRPGDVLVSVNGQAMDNEEKVLELSQEIAGSFTAEFEFLRNGRRMKGSAEINKRRM